MACPSIVRDCCAWAAGSARGKARGKQEAPPAKPRPKLEPLSADLMNFFVERRISRAVVERNTVQQERRWSHKRDRFVDMIGGCLGCLASLPLLSDVPQSSKDLAHCLCANCCA